MRQIDFPDLEDEPDAVKTMYPDPERVKSWEERQNELLDSIPEDAEFDVLHITHNDCDGYGCSVMVESAFDNVFTANLDNRGPLALENIGEKLANKFSRRTHVIISDLSPNSVEFIEPFRNFQHVTHIDHHQTPEHLVEKLEFFADDVVIDQDRCGTMIAHDYFIDNPRSEITELAEVTQDYDLWIKDDPRSDDLNDLCSATTAEEYTTHALEHGIDVLDTEWAEKAIADRQKEREHRVDILERRTTFYTFTETNLAVAYGRGDPNQLSERLEQQDIVILIYPTGGISIRTNDDYPIAHKIAQRLDGGGHEHAAGATIPIVGNDINLTTHWATHGQAAKKYVKSVVQDFA